MSVNINVNINIKQKIVFFTTVATCFTSQVSQQLLALIIFYMKPAAQTSRFTGTRFLAGNSVILCSPAYVQLAVFKPRSRVAAVSCCCPPR